MAITPLLSRVEEILAGSNVTSMSRIEVLLVELINYIETGLSSVFHYRGSVQAYSDLSGITNPEVGDVYNVIADGMDYAWTGESWDSLGTLVIVASEITSDGLAPVTSQAIYNALATKVDKINGKGLSTNDFTDADKTNLTTALEKANAAAPQSTTYTKDEADTSQAAQNSVIISLLNRGAKNMFPIDDKVMEISGNVVSQSFVLDPGVYVFTATMSGTGSTQLKFTIGSSTGETVATYSWENSLGSISHEYVISEQSTWVTMYTNAAATYSNMMLCLKSDYEASPAYVPHAPTNRELYEMILAMQNGGNS